MGRGEKETSDVLICTAPTDARENLLFLFSFGVRVRQVCSVTAVWVGFVRVTVLG